MIKHFELSQFKLNFDSDFVIIGDGESARQFNYNPEKIRILSINRGFRHLMKISNITDVVTVFWHRHFMERYINKRDIKAIFNLITITLKDIARLKLPPGDTLNIIVHYIVHEMKKRNIKDKKIFLSGVDYTYAKNWKPQIESLEYCQIMAGYNNIDIICTSKNKHLPFLKHGKPESKFLLNVPVDIDKPSQFKLRNFAKVLESCPKDRWFKKKELNFLEINNFSNVLRNMVNAGYLEAEEISSHRYKFKFKKGLK